MKSEIDEGIFPPTAMNAILSDNKPYRNDFGIPDLTPPQSAYSRHHRTEHLLPPDHWKINCTGPWVSGDIGYKPKSRLFGARPIVDRYSTTRYSVPEWQQHNEDVLRGDIIPETNETTSTTRNCIDQINLIAKKDFDDNTKQLQHRANDIYYWKCEVEYAIGKINDEINNLEVQRQRLKTAMAKILLPESIAKECLLLRGQRLEPDLVQDPPQEELITETSLIMEIKLSYERLLTQIQHQMERNVAAKERLEYDYSDKKIALQYENKNVGLNNRSTIVRDIAGMARIPEGQSDVDSWERFSQDGIREVKTAIKQSTQLREKIDATLINAARDLRTQDDVVNNALAKKIAATDQLRIELEKQLAVVLDKTVETETMIENIKDEIEFLYQQLRVSHMRLYNKHWFARPNVENCRDRSQIG